MEARPVPYRMAAPRCGGGLVSDINNLKGRVLPATEVQLYWDGNQICALVGPNLVEGVAGFGDTAHDALRALADTLVADGVWI
jgi:hypothetical protein